MSEPTDTNSIIGEKQENENHDHSQENNNQSARNSAFFDIEEDENQHDACIRLYQKGKTFLKRKDLKLEIERKKKEQEIVKELSFKPEISKKAQKLQIQRDNLYAYNKDWVSVMNLLVFQEFHR